jgi:choline dehydrogenase-like flavoprotein
MIIDARSIPESETIDADVCIVGAGTAGLTVAHEMGGSHIRVCLLESGGLKPDRETQALYRGENIGHPYFTLHSARARFFAGTTNRWNIPIDDDDCSGVRMRPLDPIDFEKRDWVPFSGWPFDKSHLDPFYDRAQDICKITPATFDLDEWVDPQETPPLPFEGGGVETVIFKFGSSRPFMEEIAPAVKNDANTTTYTYANVVELEAEKEPLAINRIRAVCLEGNSFWVKAKVFILAAGAIEIPRLLLSSNKTQINGLGNQNDLVGRFFMEHPHFCSGYLVPFSPDFFNRVSLYDHIHKVKGVPIIGKLGLSEDLIRREKLLNYVGELAPRIVLRSTLYQFLYPRIESKSVQSYRSLRSTLRQRKLPNDLSTHLRDILSGVDDFMVTGYRNIKKRILRLLDKRRIRLFHLANMSEQAPNPSSRVTLGTDRDRLGMRRVRLDWRLSDIDMESAIKSQEIVDRELQRANLGRLFIELNRETPPQRITGGWHHMGTTRMHTDLKYGVVDENCCVHGISNLFIAGPSVFPTGGYANPSLTIVALAIRLADHVKSLMA